MLEANELFEGWEDYPPVYLSVKAIVEGLGVGKKRTTEPNAMSPEDEKIAFDSMQRSAMGAIAAKAGHRLPIIVGKDPGLPKMAPVFDFAELRKRNMEVAKGRNSV